jgi:lipoprotein-anchoring transpeptidase ErfK/SrfK
MSAQRDTVASVPPRSEVAAAIAAPRRSRRRRSVRAAAVVALLAASSAVAGVTVAALQQDEGVEASPALTALAERLPAAPRPALRVGAPRPLDRIARGTATWAPVLRSALVRLAPDRTAPSVGSLTTRTPEGTTDIVQVLDRRRDAAGRLWIRVRAATLPHRSTGWVARSAVGGLQPSRAHLVVNRREATATLVRDGRVVLRVGAATRAAATPTPAGRFYVRNRLEGYDSPEYGPVAFGTSARAAMGFVGIHGTDRPDAVPGRTSGGAIVLRNADVVRLARLMPVGTPVTVR